MHDQLYKNMNVDFVLGSGFCKGSFQYGVLKGLKANRNVDIKTNKVYGVSVGGLHACTMHQKYDYSEKYYMHCDKFPLDYFKTKCDATNTIKKPNKFEFNQCVFDDFPLGDDHDRKNVFILCSEVYSGKGVWMNTNNIDIYKKCLQATISLPKIFPPVSIGNQLLQDGSIYDSFPLDECMEKLDCGKQSDLVIGINLDLNHAKSRYQEDPKVKYISIPQEFQGLSICSKKTMLHMIDCGYEIGYTIF